MMVVAIVVEVEEGEEGEVEEEVEVGGLERSCSAARRCWYSFILALTCSRISALGSSVA